MNELKNKTPLHDHVNECQVCQTGILCAAFHALALQLLRAQIQKKRQQQDDLLRKVGLKP